MERSLVYSHIYVYRVFMNLLYKGRYSQRFLNILKLIGNEVHSVCEPCFGDTAIAEWCTARGIQWTGIDCNHHFCQRARKHGFNAIESDLFALEMSDADLFIMAGSLYQFHDRLSLLFDLILSHTGRFILSEPIRNLSSRQGLIGWWAKRSANPGSGHAPFRYNEQSLLDALQGQKRRKGFNFRVVSSNRDMLIEINH